MIKVELKLLIIILTVIVLSSFYKGIDIKEGNNNQLETNFDSQTSLVLGFN